MSISSGSASSSISKSEFLSSLPPWRRWLAKTKSSPKELLNWHPTIDAQIRALESKRRELESERRTKLLEKEIAQLETENKRLEKENEQLADLESRLDALLLSADSSSQTPPATGSS